MIEPTDVAAPAGPPVHLVMRDIVKEFAGVRALNGVDFEVRGGEVLALVGENGAGKSTLINIIGGRWPAGSYEGSIAIDGQPAAFAGPHEALEAGVAVIHQELQLVPDLSVAENLFLGRLPATPRDRLAAPGPRPGAGGPGPLRLRHRPGPSRSAGSRSAASSSWRSPARSIDEHGSSCSTSPPPPSPTSRPIA